MNYRLVYIIYIAVISFVLFCMMAADKAAAKRAKRRIPEARLFLLAFLGGAPGGTLGMFAFRHKTRKWYFSLFFPLLAAAQLTCVIWIK